MHRSPAAVKAQPLANASDDFPLARQSVTRLRHCSLVVIPHIEPWPYAGLKHRSVQRIRYSMRAPESSRSYRMPISRFSRFVSSKYSCLLNGSLRMWKSFLLSPTHPKQ